MDRRRTILGGLAAAIALGLWGCGQVAPSGGTTTQATNPSYRVQQDEGPSGRVICNRRYRNCIRTLVPELGDSAMQTCQQRRDTCLDALGEGYFYRGGNR